MSSVAVVESEGEEHLPRFPTSPAFIGPPCPPRTVLMSRLRDAINRAHARAGRVSAEDRVVAETAAVMAARVVRKARMEAAQPASRFPWKTVPCKDVRTASPEEALALISGSEESARALMQEPVLPAEPPRPEDEACNGQGEPIPLPSSSQWWQEERLRQAASPFRAGQVATAKLSFKPGERPRPPPGYYLRWGRSLRLDDMSPQARADLAKLLAKDLRSGALSVVAPDDVDCLTPVFVVYHPVSLKARLVHDCRAVNARLVEATAHMPRVSEALAGLPVAAKLDLAQAFRHVGLEEADRRVLAFAVGETLFRWNALPFGSSQSPALFAAALASTLRALPEHVRLVVYVDDILVISPSREQLDADYRTLCETLRGGGWSVALDKAYPYAHTSIPFLGLIVVLDATHQYLRVSVAKATKLYRLCTAILQRNVVSLRDLQRVTGLLAFFGVAAPEARLGRSGLDAAAAEAERLPGRTVGVKGLMREDLMFWKLQATSLPELPPLPAGEDGDVIVCSDAAGLPSLGYGGVAWPSGVRAPEDFDAALGESTQYAKRLRNDVRRGDARLFSGALPASVASFSSAALEVLSFRRVLAGLAARSDLKGRTVFWFCDSTSAVAATSKWRAKAPGLARELEALLKDVRRIGCRIVPRWVARDLGWQPLADCLSKLTWRRDTVEWSMPEEAFRTATEQVGWSPTVDLFAAPGNERVTSACTEFPTAGAWTSAFAHSWSGLRAWAFPPFSAAPAALRHLCRATDARCLMVVPRTTRVPPRLRVLSRTHAPPTLRLVDAGGHVAAHPCPTPLDILDVASPDWDEHG